MRALVLCALVACGSRPVATPPPAPVPAPMRAVSTEPSVYDLGLVLRDSSGRTIGLDARRGSPVLVSMFYASCAVACPALVDDLARTLADAPSDTKVLLVSFDAARDTPAKLDELLVRRRLDPARWTIASATDTDARELAAAIGYRYRKLDSGEFFHGATIVLLDEAGRPLARSEGFNQRATLLAALGR